MEMRHVLYSIVPDLVDYGLIRLRHLTDSRPVVVIEHRVLVYDDELAEIIARKLRDIRLEACGNDGYMYRVAALRVVVPDKSALRLVHRSGI